MYSQWHANSGQLNQPIQLWQLEDAHQAVRLAEKRLADAQYAYARETEQLHTTIAAYEQSASVREKNLRALRQQVSELEQEQATVRTDYEASLAEAEKHVSEISLEYTAETKRMREVVAHHQLTAAEREAARNHLQQSLDKSEAALSQLQQDHTRLREHATNLRDNNAQLQGNNKALQQRQKDLSEQVAEKSATLAQSDLTMKDRLAQAELQLVDKETEIKRLRIELDETETQHRSDVESQRQLIAELELASANEIQTIQDLDRLCDQRASEIEEARLAASQAIEQVAETAKQLADSRSDHAVERELLQEEIDLKTHAIAAQATENEQLKEELTLKQAELDEVAQVGESIDLQLNEAVQAHTQQVAKLEAAMAQSNEKVSSRKTELRALAMRTYTRETQFKQIVADLRSEAAESLREATLQHESEIEPLREAIVSLEETGNDRESLIHELKQQIEQLRSDHLVAMEQARIASADREQQAAVYLAQVQTQLSGEVQQLQAELLDSASQLQVTQQELAQTREELQSTAQDQSFHSLQSRELATRASELQAILTQVQQDHFQAQQESQLLLANQEARLAGADQQVATLGHQLTQIQHENELLRSDLNAHQAAAETNHQRAEQLTARLKKVIRIHKKIKSHPETLRRFREHVIELNHQINEQSRQREHADFTITQLNRTVTWLEHTSEQLQDSIQREAAARRKAESVLKQLTEDHPDADQSTLAQSAAKQIESEEKINRLTRELQATKKMRLIERKQAEAELKRVSDQLNQAAPIRRAA